MMDNTTNRGADIIPISTKANKAKSGKGTRPNNAHSFGLTERQESFAQMAATGAPLSDCYRAFYSVGNMKPATIWKRASDTAAKGHVKARIQGLVEAKRKATQHDADRTRAFVIEKLQHEAEHAETAGARVRALELLGKMADVSLFVDRVETTDNSATAEQIEQELRTQLDNLLKQTG